MNEMKKYKTTKSVYDGRKTKKQASVELGLSIRQINRLTRNYQLKGKAAFSHGNKKRSPKHVVPKEIKEKMITLYSSYEVKPNVVHFTEYLHDNYHLTYSDTTVRKILREVFILSPKSQRKTRREVKKEQKKSLKKEFYK